MARPVRGLELGHGAGAARARAGVRLVLPRDAHGAEREVSVPGILARRAFSAASAPLGNAVLAPRAGKATRLPATKLRLRAEC